MDRRATPMLSLLFTLALVASSAGVGLATPVQPTDAATTTGTVDDDDRVQLTVVHRVSTVAGGDDLLEVELSIEASRLVEGVTVDLPGGATVERVDGFELKPGFNGVYRWTDLDGSITYRTTVGSNNEVFGGRDTAATRDWALVQRERVEATVLRVVGTDVSSRFEGPDGAAAGHELVMVGVRADPARTVRGQHIRLVVPIDTRPDPGIDGALDAVADGSEGLLVGHRDEELTVFVARDPVRRGGLALRSGVRRQDVWVHAEEDANDPHNVWIHEYVHTRQSLSLADDMEWFREASAEYYAALLTYRNGGTPFSTFHSDISRAGRYRSATLADSGTWSSPRVPYRKGPRVLAALDASIQRESHGRSSLQQVFAWMNQADDPVDTETFDTYVRRAAGTSLRDFLDSYVRSRGVPSVPTDSSLFRPATFEGDPDSDGIPTTVELEKGTSPLDPDTDGDGLKDLGEEDTYGTDPLSADTDGDGLEDGVEREQYGSNPNAVDTDGDGVSDYTEASRYNTDLLSADTDDDGLDDGEEIDGPTHPLKDDTDEDGLLDGEEVHLGSDPMVPDTDGDGLADGREADANADPTRADTDGDGLSDLAEVTEHGTDPTASDTDDDGLDDPTELDGPTDPADADSDGDGLTDGREYEVGTDPTTPDTDGDAIVDGDEADHGTDPLSRDTDGDGIWDESEVRDGTDPTSADSDGDGLDDAREDELGTDPTAETGTLDRLVAQVQLLLGGLVS